MLIVIFNSFDCKDYNHFFKKKSKPQFIIKKQNITRKGTTRQKKKINEKPNNNILDYNHLIISIPQILFKIHLKQITFMLT